MVLLVENSCPFVEWVSDVLLSVIPTCQVATRGLGFSLWTLPWRCSNEVSEVQPVKSELRFLSPGADFL